MAENKYLSDAILIEVLTRAADEERESLAAALPGANKRKLSPQALQQEIGAAAGHSVMNWLRNGKGVSYLELLSDAAKTLKVDGAPTLSTLVHGPISIRSLDWLPSTRASTVDPAHRLKLVDAFVDELERKLLSKLLLVAYEHATPEQRAAVDAEVAQFAKSSGGKGLSGLSTSAALLVLGNLGGFATYTLMSTVLSALSFGALGFGGYTLASSALSIALGPAGWITLAAVAVFKLGGPDARVTVQLAATCAMTSQRLRELSRHSP